MKTRCLFAIALTCALALTATLARAADPLPSWNDTAPKQAILAFVEKVTNAIAASIGACVWTGVSRFEKS